MKAMIGFRISSEEMALIDEARFQSGADISTIARGFFRLGLEVWSKKQKGAVKKDTELNNLKLAKKGRLDWQLKESERAKSANERTGKKKPPS